MPKTLYAQLADKLAEDIASGRYPVGTLLPTEQELCEQFSASRFTVRAAIKQLKDMGLVSSRKKVGTRVESSSAIGGYKQKLATVDDLLQFDYAHSRIVSEVGDFVADIAFSREMGCPAGTHWLRIAGVRVNQTEEKLPMAWTEVYIDPAYTDIKDTVMDSPEALVSKLIESRYGRSVAEIRQDIQAILIPAGLAAQLKTKTGQPAFRILRRYIDQNNEVFEMSVNIHPADRFTFSMKLLREQG